MAIIAQNSIDQVKAAADMVEIVGARTQLRKVGARWTGRCPFHEERTPSFSVNAADKLFYCFGCGMKGDLITFVKETEGLDFVGAIEWLAERYRIPLAYEETSPQAEAKRDRRNRLLSLLEQAAVYYERNLWDSAAGAPAREYLAERGLGEAVCREYRLGLSPGGAVLAQKARAKGFSPDELVAAGLVNRRGNDYFAGRLVFPLADARGRVLGFGARRMGEDDPIPAKYVNSPEGDVFRKGSIVYGLDRARATVTKEDRAVVVEGYTDVLALHQAGLGAAVASMGTALTQPQLKELRRLTRHLYLCFDADAAGEAATIRGMARRQGSGGRGGRIRGPTRRVGGLPAPPRHARDRTGAEQAGGVRARPGRPRPGIPRTGAGRSSQVRDRQASGPVADRRRQRHGRRGGAPEADWSG
jgi:DNA primase